MVRSVDLRSAEKADDNTDHSDVTLRKTDGSEVGGITPKGLVLPMLFLHSHYERKGGEC